MDDSCDKGPRRGGTTGDGGGLEVPSLHRQTEQLGLVPDRVSSVGLTTVYLCTGVSRDVTERTRVAHQRSVRSVNERKSVVQ